MSSRPDKPKKSNKSKKKREEGAKSLVKKLSLGKIYRKKKEEEPAVASAHTSLEEVEVGPEDPVSSEVKEVEATASKEADTQDPQDALDPQDTQDPQDAQDAQDTQDSGEQHQEPEETAEEAILQEKLAQLNQHMSKVVQGPSGEVKRECLYKILVIGELGTGKTSIIKRYVHQFFSQHYRATIGVDFALKVINWDSNTIIRLQLWDIAGQERYGNMTRVYYKEAVGALIVFDVTRAATFDAVLKWKQDLDNKVQLPDGGPIPCVLLANKCDQQKEGIVNNPNKMDEYCKENHFTGWYETSAKENINIEEAAKTLVSQILSKDMASESGRAVRDNGKFPLESSMYDSADKHTSCSC